jgi:hypothetical protein
MFGKPFEYFVQLHPDDSELPGLTQVPQFHSMRERKTWAAGRWLGTTKKQDGTYFKDRRLN